MRTEYGLIVKNIKFGLILKSEVWINHESEVWINHAESEAFKVFQKLSVWRETQVIQKEGTRRVVGYRKIVMNEENLVMKTVLNEGN